MKDLSWLADWVKELAPLAPIVPAFFFPGCDCCQQGDFIYTSCEEDCDETPDCWDLSVSGVGDDVCTGGLCPNWNGEFRLEKDSKCLWRSDTFSTQRLNNSAACQTAQSYWELGDNVLDAVGLTVDLQRAVSASYRTPSGTLFNCNETNVLELFSVNNEACGGWPETLTITPCSGSTTTTTAGTTTT